MLQQLPTELQLAILQILPNDDFRNLRLTCRNLGDTGKLILNDKASRLISYGRRHWTLARRRGGVSIIDCARHVLILSECFSQEVSSLMTDLQLHDYTGYLVASQPARPNQPSDNEYEMLDSYLSRIRLPALQQLRLESMTSNGVQVLINLIDNHAKTLQLLTIRSHGLRHRTCSMEMFRTGVGLRYEWKPLFQSMLSIVDRPLKLQLLILSALAVELPHADKHRRFHTPTVNELFRVPFRTTQTPFIVRPYRVPEMIMQTAEGTELCVKETGKKPTNLRIEGKHAIRQGLQMLITGDASYLNA